MDLPQPMQTRSRQRLIAQEAERARRSGNVSAPRAPSNPAVQTTFPTSPATSTASPVRPSNESMHNAPPSPVSPVKASITRPTASQASATSSVTPASRTSLNRVRNGDPRQANAMELIVYGRAHHHHSTAVSVMEGVLRRLQGKNIGTERLRVRPADPGALYRQHAVRIAWAQDVWGRDWDLVARLEEIRKELKAEKCEAFWSNCAAEDMRSCAVVCFTPPSPLNADSVRFTPEAATTWLRNFCASAGFETVEIVAEEVKPAELRNTSGRGSTNQPEGRKKDGVFRVLTRLFTPSDLEALEKKVSEEKPEFASHSVEVSRPRNRINLTHPTSIASPDRTEADMAWLVEELNDFVALYNEQHGTQECLLLLDSGQQAELILDSYLIVTPSSLGLSQYLCSQTPYYGLPYESCYQLNGRQLMPQQEAEEKERQQAQRSLNKLRTDVQQLWNAAEDNRKKLDKTLVESARRQTAFVTFCQDAADRYKASIANQQTWNSRHERVMVLTTRIGSLENDLKAMQREKALAAERLEFFPSEAVLHSAHIKRLEGSIAEDKTRIKEVRAELNALLAQKVPVSAPSDSTGLGLIREADERDSSASASAQGPAKRARSS